MNIKEKYKKIVEQDLLMKITVIVVVINILFIIVGSILFSIKNSHFTYKNFSIGLIVLAIINAINIIILFIKKKYRKNLVHLFIIFILFFTVIAVIFAREKKRAIWGIGGRFEGLFTILYYFSALFLTSFVDKKYKKTIINFILFAGVIHSIFAIYQKLYLMNVFGLKDVNFLKDIYKITWINGFTINPDFLGSFIIICLLYSIGLFLDENNKKKVLGYFLYSLLFTFVLIINNTQSCIVAFVISFIFTLIYSIKNKKIKKFLIITIMIVILTVVTSKLNMTKVISHIIKTGTEATELAKGNADDSFGSFRIKIWKKTLQVVPQHLLHGVGVDDFCHAFGDKPLVFPINGKNLIFDKAHNEYLQLLVTQGIFSLLSYLALYGTIVIRGIKNAFKNKEIYLVLPIIGYLIQAFFNISVIEVAPIFFIALGLGIYDKEIKQNKEKNYNL